MNAIAQRLRGAVGRKAQNWARRRQGLDPHSTCIAGRRIYILPTRAGMIYAVVVFTMLLGSMNYNNNMGFALTFLLAGIGIISIYHCHRNIADIFLHFAGSQPTFAGESVRFDYVIENRSVFSRAQVRFGCDGGQEICDSLPAGDRQQVGVRVVAKQRGRCGLPRLLLSTRYPLGLFRAWAWINTDIAEVVYPRPAPFAAPSTTTHAGDSTAGQRQSGDDDFSGFRTYRAGDPPKHIAWKVLARSGETVVTEYHGGGTDPVWLDWDDYPSPDPEDRLSLLARRVLDIAAAGETWGLRIPGMEIEPDHGATHQNRCLQALALFDTDSQYGTT